MFPFFFYRNGRFDVPLTMRPAFDENKQHTLSSAVTISGPGLHSGIHADLTLKPERAGFGLRFQRMDLSDQPVIPADCELVSDTFRCTTLTKYGASVATVEHVLAALVGSGIDNCLIEINGPEVPILDGSCATFMQLIEQAGVTEQHAPKIWYHLDSELAQYYPEKNVHMFAYPAKEYSIETCVYFKNEALVEQRAQLERISDFKKEIAPCRTYCLVDELEMLIDKNLIKGDIVKNAILFIDKPISEMELVRLQKKFHIGNIAAKDGGYVNNLELHFDNEIARHKLLDVIGDLALIGFPIRAKIRGIRPGHSTNVNFAKRIKEHINKKARKMNAIRA